MFKIGDRIICIKTIDNNKIKNKVGTVMSIESDGWLLVEFDQHINGHCFEGHGWFVKPENCILYDDLRAKDTPSIFSSI